MVVERLLDGMELAVPREPLDGRDLRAVGLDAEHRAGLHRLAVHEHGACTARRGVAADVRPGQPEPLPQHVHEKLTRLELQLVARAVDGKRHSSHPALLSPRCSASVVRRRAVPPHRSAGQVRSDALACRHRERGMRHAHRFNSHCHFVDPVRCDRGDAEAAVRARRRALRRAAARSRRGRRPRAPTGRRSLPGGQSPRRLDRGGRREDRRPRLRGHRARRLDHFQPRDQGHHDSRVSPSRSCGRSRRFRTTRSASSRRSAAAPGSRLRAG